MASSSNRTILQPRSRLSTTQQGQASSSRTSYAQQGYMQSPPQSSRYAQQPTFAQRSLEDQYRIDNAATFASENELLIWSSLERNESIPQTKLHYARDMLLIDSDEEAQHQHDEDESGSGSVEWEEDHTWTSDDEARMRVGVRYGPDGWWDPRVHSSAAERLREEGERRRAAAAMVGMAGPGTQIKAEEVRSPARSGKKKSSGTPGSGKKRGKRPSGSGSQQQY